MNISAPFIARPVATCLLAIAILLTGALGYTRLPVSALPQVDFPTIEVTTQLPGASPDSIALLVTASLERQLAQISGLTDMLSVSGPGVSRITLQFSLSRNIDDAALDVQAAINAAKGTLPSSLPYPPVYSKVNPADPPILTLALSSDTLPISRLADAADTLLAQRLAQVQGVGRVTVQGNMRPAIRLQADPRRLASYDLGLEDLRNAIVAANVAGAKGSLDGPQQASTIQANDQINTPKDFANVIVAWRNSAPVRFKDIGVTSEDLENRLTSAWHNGKPAVLIDVQRQPGANIVQTVESVRAQLAQLSSALPAGAQLKVVSDRTEIIRASVQDVEFTLILAVLLVVAVIYLFLRTWRATIVPGVALPLSIVGTFGVMSLCGFSLDNLSLMALTIATGFVVDDAIVMIENVVRLMEEGKKPLEAAFEGAKQIGFTVVSLTVSLIAVFIPLLFMTGVVGRLFQEFALTLTIAVLVSMVISLTLTPMMCGRLLRDPKAERVNWLLQRTEAGFEKLRGGYARSLAWALRNEPLMLGIALLTVVGTVMLYIWIPKGFLPQQDTGLITITTEGPEDASFKRMDALQHQLGAIVQQDPDVTSVTMVTGAGTVNNAANTGTITAVLRPRDDRSAGVQEIIARLQPKLATVPGIVAHLQPVQDIQIGARVSSTQFQYTLMDVDQSELGLWAPRLVQVLEKLPQLRDVSSDQRLSGLGIHLNINRDQAARLDVTMQSIDDTLYDAFGQRQISTIYAQNNQYRVVLEATPGLRDDPAMIGQLRVPGASSGISNGTGASTSNSGAASSSSSATGSASAVNVSNAATGTASYQIPLSAIATIERTRAPLVITREDQFPSVTIGFDLAKGASLGDAVDAIRKAEASLGMPDTISGQFSGDAAEFDRSLASEPWLILAAVVVIYIVLGVLYESLIHPITILSTLPSAGIGALLALWICGLDLSIVGLIGIVLLMGIVKKNAIMMIDFALEAQREHGMSPREAITEACLLRFRPIMMTTMAALLGAVPLVVSHGAGSELRLPLGIAVVGGLLLSQFITLYTTPVIYLGMEQVRLRCARALDRIRRTPDSRPPNSPPGTTPSGRPAA